MSAIIIQMETHPDRCIESVIGPFDNWHEASTAARAFEEHPSNFWPHKGKICHFVARDLTAPKNGG